MTRHDGRKPDELRRVKFTRSFTRQSPGSVLVEMGETMVLCTASVVPGVPRWMENQGRGWITAEYGMLPGSTGSRKIREAARGKQEGRTQEIQRLIGRAMRSVVAMNNLGMNTVWLDCDVLQADGGTRTAAITGSFVALADALKWMEKERMLFKWPLVTEAAAVSVGIVNGEAVLDLDYEEDSTAAVDMNVVMSGKGEFIEVQGTAEEQPFSQEQMTAMLDLARKGIGDLLALQKKALAQEMTAK